MLRAIVFFFVLLLGCGAGYILYQRPAPEQPEPQPGIEQPKDPEPPEPKPEPEPKPAEPAPVEPKPVEPKPAEPASQKAATDVVTVSRPLPPPAADYNAAKIKADELVAAGRKDPMKRLQNAAEELFHVPD